VAVAVVVVAAEKEAVAVVVVAAEKADPARPLAAWVTTTR